MQEYCVVLGTQRTGEFAHLLAKRCYLRARTANQAMLIASEDPEWRVIGIEPAAMSIDNSSLPHLKTEPGTGALTRKILRVARSRATDNAGAALAAD